MSENSKPKVPQTVNNWLRDAADTLADAMIPSARLDAELILAHTLNKPRTWLHAHGDEEIDEREFDLLESRVAQRLERIPIAYIIGTKEFYGRNFTVNPDVLIPRPESEDLITLLLGWLSENTTAKRLVDVGCGSGCLGITAKLENPQLDVTLCDIDEHALTIAEENAAALHADVNTLRSNLLIDYPFRADVILANLPYVGRSWDVSLETAHEPDLALYADDDGLEFIYELIEQSSNKLTSRGALILESDLRQHQSIETYARSNRLKLTCARGLGQLFEKL